MHAVFGDDRMAEMRARFREQLAELEARTNDRLAKLEVQQSGRFAELAELKARYSERLAELEARDGKEIADLRARMESRGCVYAAGYIAVDVAERRPTDADLREIARHTSVSAGFRVEPGRCLRVLVPSGARRIDG